MSQSLRSDVMGLQFWSCWIPSAPSQETGMALESYHMIHVSTLYSKISKIWNQKLETMPSLQSYSPASEVLPFFVDRISGFPRRTRRTWTKHSACRGPLRPSRPLSPLGWESGPTCKNFDSKLKFYAEMLPDFPACSRTVRPCKQSTQNIQVAVASVDHWSNFPSTGPEMHPSCRQQNLIMKFWKCKNISDRSERILM